MQTRTYARTAFSLIEVVIASAIFVGLSVALLESMASAKRYEAGSIITDDLVNNGDSVVRTITTDLAASGWYFYGQKDSNGDGVISANENVDGTAVATVNFADATTDRRMRYYPYVRGETAATIGSAFPTRVDIDSGMVPALSTSRVVGLSPWTTRLYPGWNSGQIPALAAAIRSNAANHAIWLPGSAATVNAAADAVTDLQNGTIDLASEMVKPSNELIFLRAATGPWNADPSQSDNFVPSDLNFFPRYDLDASGALIKPKGAAATDWRNPGDQYGPSNTNGLPVLFPSSYKDDGSGGYVHRNSVLPITDPNYGQPYGARSWGAYLDDGGSGLAIRMQWETISADRMGKDPNPGVDDFPKPDDLREFTYAVIPSPFGFGRLVRAHVVLAAGSTPTLGIEVGNWITDVAQPRGYQIDKILSDDVVRAVWLTRRHDPTLGANQIRLRLVLARLTSHTNQGGDGTLAIRQIDQIFAMHADSTADSQVTNLSLIDTGTNNVPYTY